MENNQIFAIRKDIQQIEKFFSTFYTIDCLVIVRPKSTSIRLNITGYEIILVPKTASVGCSVTVSTNLTSETSRKN